MVDTTNFSTKSDFMGSHENLHLVETFTRVSKDVMNYEFTVDDPTTWTAPWTAMIPLKQKDEMIFEYACHEGNEAVPDMLRAIGWKSAKLRPRPRRTDDMVSD